MTTGALDWVIYIPVLGIVAVSATMVFAGYVFSRETSNQKIAKQWRFMMLIGMIILVSWIAAVLIFIVSNANSAS